MSDVTQLPPLDPASLLSAQRRERDLAHLSGGHSIDVLVVGGGITGVGVALDAATRGLSVALVEQDDLANGTSRWSSKLVHGGLRYLAKGDPAVAWESAAERAILAGRVAPHLVHPLAQVVPDFDHDRRSARLALLGQRAGDALRVAAGTPSGLLPRARHVDADLARQLVPGIRHEGLRGAAVGWDCQLVDDARLVVAVARTAAAYGARILTRVRVSAVDPASGDVTATDTLTGEQIDLHATTVVNATGVWASDLDDSITLHPSLGTHVVVPTSLVGAGHGSLTVPVPGTIGRFILSLPQLGGISYVGLTDNETDTDSFAAPTPPEADIAWILEILSTALERPVTPADALGAFAGVRPLVQSADAATSSADISRKHLVRRTDRLITVTGEAHDVPAHGRGRGGCDHRDRVPDQGRRLGGSRTPGEPVRRPRRPVAPLRKRSPDRVGSGCRAAGVAAATRPRGQLLRRRGGVRGGRRGGADSIGHRGPAHPHRRDRRLARRGPDHGHRPVGPAFGRGPARLLLILVAQPLKSTR